MSVSILIYMMVFMPIVGAFVSYLVGRKSKQIRDYVVSGIAIAEFVFAVALFLQYESWTGGLIGIPEVCGLGLYFAVDGFRVVYAAIAAFMWMVTALFSKEYFQHYRNRNRYYLFQLITLGATEAIFLSADLYTTFIFFEIMSLASYVWVAQDERGESLRAAATYLAVAVIGGLSLLMGLFLLYTQAGTLKIDELYEACQGKDVYAACLCMLVGFGAKAGAFPLQIWLPKAHPVAPAPASALLSGILTKTGIFGVLVISSQILLHDAMWGTLILLIGVITMFIGALLALFSVDFKRTLACSSVSQIGFILVGVGMQGLLADENAIAIHGTMLHMVNHSLFKLVLFLVAGVIFMNTHKLNLNEIRGYGRKKPWLAAIYLMGALGIGGIPLWSGYISKTLLHESIVEYVHGLESGHIAQVLLSAENMQVIEWIFLISGGMTIAYMCKLFVAVFVEKNENSEIQEQYDAQTSYCKPVTKVILSISAALFLLMGVLPHVIMDKVAVLSESFMGFSHEGHQVNYFTWTNLQGALISLAIGVLIYVLLIRGLLMVKQENGSRRYVNRWCKYLDMEDYIYRPVLLQFLPTVFGFLCRVLDRLVDGIVVLLRMSIYKDSPIRVEPDEGNEVTYGIGTLLNKIQQLLNKSIHRQNPKEKDYVHKAAMAYAGFKENMTFIGRSLSYGLILFCLGLCTVLIYLLVSSVL